MESYLSVPVVVLSTQSLRSARAENVRTKSLAACPSGFKHLGAGERGEWFYRLDFEILGVLTTLGNELIRREWCEMSTQLLMGKLASTPTLLVRGILNSSLCRQRDS